MSKVIFEVSVSIDGFIAGINGGPGNPLGDGGMNIHEWMYNLKSWRELVGLMGGINNDENKLVQESAKSTGAYVMGKDMFMEGEVHWPEYPPFQAPVYVLTREKENPGYEKAELLFISCLALKKYQVERFINLT